MGIGNWLGFGKDLSEPINAIGDLYTTDKDRIKAQAAYQEVAQKPQMAQLAINQTLASSSNWFSNSWQPLIGWSAGFLVLLYYAPQIVIVTYVWGYNCVHSGIVNTFPIKPDDIINLVWLLFGFGGYSLGKGAISKI